MGEKRKMVLTVYLSGFLTGITLILLPAAGPLFTDPDFHNLSSSEFGFLFTPQILTSVSLAVLAARFARRFGMKRILITGVLASMSAMALVVLSGLFMGEVIAYVLLLLAFAASGMGVGFTLTAVNAYAFDFFRGHADAAINGAHTLVGVGQISAPLVLSLFVGLAVWWMAPLLIALGCLLMVFFQVGLPLRLSTEQAVSGENDAPPEKQSLGFRIWLYIGIVILYGISEATFGNWTAIYLEEEAGLTISAAGLALSLFWGMVTLGRLTFAFASLRLNLRPLFVLSPFLVGGIFLIWPDLDNTALYILSLALGGLALSFYYPFTISIASAEKPASTAAISGLTVGMLGLGIGYSSNVIGLISESAGLPLAIRLSSIYAILMGVTAAYLSLSRSRQVKAKIKEILS